MIFFGLPQALNPDPGLEIRYLPCVPEVASRGTVMGRGMVVLGLGFRVQSFGFWV